MTSPKNKMKTRALDTPLPKSNEIICEQSQKPYFLSKIHSKTYRFCANYTSSLTFNPDEESQYRRCHYNTEVKNYKDSHRCIFSLPLPKSWEPTIDHEMQKNLSLLFDDSIAQLVVELNISINKGAGAPFLTFVNEIFQAGVAWKSKNSESKNPPRIKTDRKRIREHILEASEESLKITQNFIDTNPHYSFMLDVGTVKNRHALYWCVGNPASSNRQYIVDTKKIDPWGASDYYSWGKEQLLAYPNLCGFVGDCLPAQIAGLAHYHKAGLCAQPEFASRCIFSPCYNHILNHAFLDAIIQDDGISHLMESLSDLLVILRKPWPKICLSCNVPQLVSTRWIYAYDILLWICKREIAIRSLLRTPPCAQLRTLLQKARFSRLKDEHLLDKFKILMEILKPLKRLQLTIEACETPMAYVYPLLQETKRLYIEMVRDSKDKTLKKEWAELMIQCLDKRFNGMGRMALCITAFALSPAGRKQIRREMELETSYIKHVLLTALETNEEVDFEDDEEEEDDEWVEYSIEEEDYEDIDSDFEEDIAESNRESGSLSWSKKDGKLEIVKPKKKKNLKRCTTKTPSNLLSRINKDPLLSDTHDASGFHAFDDVIIKDKNTFDIALEVLKNREADESKKQEIEAAFTRFCIGTQQEPTPNLGVLIHTVDFGYSYWFSVHKVKGFELLSKRALEFLAIPASEAECERLVSKSRYVYTAYQQREKEDLTRARIIAFALHKQLGITSLHQQHNSPHYTVLRIEKHPNYCIYVFRDNFKKKEVKANSDSLDIEMKEATTTFIGKVLHADLK
jgi:hypothetical protein